MKGRETGCCGHVIEVDGEEVVGTFKFNHPYGKDPWEYARKFVTEEMGEAHVSDLDWDNCRIVDD